MAQASKPRRAFGVLALAIVLALALLLVPGVAAAAGNLLGGLWVSTMGAVFGLIGGLFGG